MIIDAHQHFWQLSRNDYGWLTPELTTLYQNFLPNDLKPILDENGVDGTIVVQAAPTLAETKFLLSLAEQNPFIKGVVGWVDFENPSAISDLEELAGHNHFVGVRPMIQDIDDVDWMLKPELSPVFEKLIQLNLTFDALVHPKHLANLHVLLTRHPTLTTVIDHAAKPDIANQEIKQWQADLQRIALDTNAYCKLSGLTTEAKSDWTIQDLQPYVDCLLDSFGAERLIWGSDWPVCLLATDYEAWLRTSQRLLSSVKQSSQNIFGLNAIRAYQL